MSGERFFSTRSSSGVHWWCTRGCSGFGRVVAKVNRVHHGLQHGGDDAGRRGCRSPAWACRLQHQGGVSWNIRALLGGHRVGVAADQAGVGHAGLLAEKSSISLFSKMPVPLATMPLRLVFSV